VVSSTPWPHFTPGKDLVPILQEAGWAPGPVWTDGKSHPHRDSIPDHPARSQSLYRLSYPAHNLKIMLPIYLIKSLSPTRYSMLVISVLVHVILCSRYPWCMLIVFHPNSLISFLLSFICKPNHCHSSTSTVVIRRQYINSNCNSPKRSAII